MNKVTTWESLVATRPWVRSLEEHIEQYILRGDSINIWGLPTLGTSLQIRKITSHHRNATSFVYIDTQLLSDLTQEGFITLINSKLIEVTETPKIFGSSELSSVQLTRHLIHEITERNPISIIIDTIENLVPLNKSFFPTFRAVRDEFIGHINFIFVSNRPLYDHPGFNDNKQFVEFASHVECVSDLFPDEAISEFIRQIQTEYRRTFAEEDIASIVSLCGGSLGILKHILRSIDQGVSTNYSESVLYQDHTIHARLDRIIETFTDNERQYLHNIALALPPGTKATEFIQKSGVVVNGKIRGTLLRHAFADYQPQVTIESTAEQTSIRNSTHRKKKGLQFDPISGEIFIDGIRLPETLSKTEVQIILALQEPQPDPVTKEQIAQKMWKEEYKDKYSEWAIDKAISRIRKKMNDNTYPHRFLITLKGRGYKLYTE